MTRHRTIRLCINWRIFIVESFYYPCAPSECQNNLLLKLRLTFLSRVAFSPCSIVHGPHLRIASLLRTQENVKPSCQQLFSTRPPTYPLTRTQCTSHNYGRVYSPFALYMFQQQHSLTRCNRTRNHVSSLGLTKSPQKSHSTSQYVIPSSL